MERPQTHYARSGELAIAYQVHGSGDHDLLMSGGPSSNIETVWSLPEAARLFERLGQFTPTLVLHPRDLSFVSGDAVREFAEPISNATFREIPGDAAVMYALDVELLADIIEEFVTGTAPAPPTDRILATVLFTDLVGSTQRAARSGDQAWTEVLKRHLDHARSTVADHGGETIKTTGDGVLAIFTGPGQGVRCAEQVITDARDLGLEVRSGLHTGEVERSRDDVAGLAVHLAARIMGLAGAGEILVSGTVRDLVIGGELTFSDRGEHELKGIPGPWTIWAAT